MPAVRVEAKAPNISRVFGVNYQRREVMKANGVSQPLARREFLRISSTAVIGIADSGFLNPKALLAAATASSAFQPLLSIGFAPSLPEVGSSVVLGSADSLLMPDPLFISRGARVTVHGSGRAPKQKNAPGSLFLDAVFPAKSGAAADDRRFRFWSMSGRNDSDSFSGNVSFNVPVLATTGLSFLARYKRPAIVTEAASNTPPPLEQDNAPFTLSLGGVAGPKLQRGVYVVALRESADESSPNWSRLRVANNNGSIGLSGASFAYVILEVAYGEVSPANPGRRRIAG